ncbi:MAG: endonuclease III domain-containing protein [Candidatus Omnitrophica bacterium]|nr:endonuclease III domain-containing protein [Candidatus Omnitrophota bacterium]
MALRKQRKTLLDIYERLYSHYGPQEWWPGRTRFEVIVGAILTQNTAWTNVEKAIANIRKARLLSPAALRKIPHKDLARLIRPAGYYNIKAKRLKNFIRYLFSNYAGSLNRASRRPTEDLRKELLAVNGIGPETCDSILLYAFEKPVFVVDAYTKRIFSRHHLFGEKADYHDAQTFFMDALAHDPAMFNEYHALIVALGKEFCRKRPRCGACPLKGFKSA